MSFSPPPHRTTNSAPPCPLAGFEGHFAVGNNNNTSRWEMEGKEEERGERRGKGKKRIDGRDQRKTSPP